MLKSLKIEGNFSCLRAKSAHFVGHLPPGDLFLADGQQWQAIRVNRKTITAVCSLSGTPWDMKIEPERVREIVWRSPPDQKPCTHCKNGKVWYTPPGVRYGYGGGGPECELCNGSGLVSR